MKILEFAFIGYPVTDLKRARAFYEQVLGFKPGSIWGDEDDKAWIEYEVGPHTLAINNMDPANWKPSTDGAGVALEVENFDAALEEIKKANVPIVWGPGDFPSCQMALVADPDGNRICIHKRKPQP